MTKDVLITVHGVHVVDGVAQEPVDLTVRGRYYKQNGHHYFLYDEQLEGMDSPAHNRVKYTGDTLDVKKSGSVNSHMIFERGKMNVSDYNTEVGTLELGVCARTLTIEEKDMKITVHVEYSLHAGGSKVQDSSLTISAVPYPIF